MKKLIFTKGGGRLGNQLVLFSHLLAFQHEHPEKLSLANLSIWPYAFLLKNYSQLLKKGFPFLRLLYRILSSLKLTNKRLVLKGVYFILHLLGKLLWGWQSLVVSRDVSVPFFLMGKDMAPLDLGKKELLTDVFTRKVNVLAGWKMRSWSLFFKHQDSIRKDLEFKEEYCSGARIKIQKFKEDYDEVIGVFIRQGDYKEWHGGKFFLSTEGYAALMKSVANKYKEKKLLFLIASGDKQDQSFFNGLNIEFTNGYIENNGHYVESLIELSMCDKIISVPSTFSFWAAFIGMKSLWLIEKSPALQEDLKVLNITEEELRNNEFLMEALK